MISSGCFKQQQFFKTLKMTQFLYIERFNFDFESQFFDKDNNKKNILTIVMSLQNIKQTQLSIRPKLNSSNFWDCLIIFK